MGTKLHQAIAKGDLAEVKNRLSKHRAKNEIAATDGQDQVPLVAAIYQNNVQMVEEILNYYRTQKPKDITINQQVCFFVFFLLIPTLFYRISEVILLYIMLFKYAMNKL